MSICLVLHSKEGIDGLVMQWEDLEVKSEDGAVNVSSSLLLRV